MPDPDPFAALATDLAADHKEEKRKRRMARPSFEAASIEMPGFLKKEKPEIPDNAVIAKIAPPRPNIGCAWHNPETGQTKYWHGTAWYLAPPAAQAVEALAEAEPTDASETLAALDGPLPDESDVKFEPIDNWDEAEPFAADEPEESETVTTDAAEVTTDIRETSTDELEPWGPEHADFVGAKKPAEPEHGDKWWKGDGEMRWYWAHDENGADKNRWFQRPPVDSPDHEDYGSGDTATPAPAATVKESVTVAPDMEAQAEPVPEPAPKPKAEPKLYQEPQFDPEPVTEFVIPDDGELLSFEPEYDFDTSSLVCDVRDAMLEQFKHRPKPWAKLSQDEQRDVVAALENNAEAMVRGVLEKLATHDESSIRCLLESYQEKDGIKIVMKLHAFAEEETEKAVVFLHRWRGKTVMVRMADAGDYHGHIDAETMPDQPEIDWNAQVTDAYGGDNSDLADFD